ncbi:MAG: TVP38/TMEM64 family protein [Chloroflexi bacterium]|nr:TVP38/TMEM64 family protein [Chloroflexota bacterium]
MSVLGQVPAVPRPTRKQAMSLLAVALASVALSFVVDRVFGVVLPLDPLVLRDWLRGWGAAAPLIYIGLMALAIVVTPIPSVPLDIAAGLVFGLFWGTVYTLIGAQLGATICFALARRFGRPWVERRLPRQAVASIDQMVDRLGASTLFLMRLLPVFNFDWVSYAAGLTRLSFRTFTLATFGGMLAPVIAIVAVGDALISNPGRAALIFGLLVLLAVLPLVGWIAWPANDTVA